MCHPSKNESVPRPGPKSGCVRFLNRKCIPGQPNISELVVNESGKREAAEETCKSILCKTFYWKTTVLCDFFFQLFLFLLSFPLYPAIDTKLFSHHYLDTNSLTPWTLVCDPLSFAGVPLLISAISYPISSHPPQFRTFSP